MRHDLYAELFQLEGHHFWHRTKRALVLDAVVAVERARGGPGRALELGCGAGRLQEELAARGWEAWGSDHSPQALAFCRQRGLTRLVEHDATRPLPGELGRFDLILALDLLEHLKDDEGALLAWREALAPGGHVLLHVPAHPGLFGYWDTMLGHQRRYRRQELRAVCARSGLEVLRLTPTFAWLLPPAAAFRALRRGADPTRASSDFAFAPAPLNALLAALGALEARWLREHDLPFGLSLLALCRRVEDAPREQAA